MPQLLPSNCAVVTPWHRAEQRDAFLAAWQIESPPDWLVLQQDEDRSGCAVTKNRGVQRAVVRGADIVLVLDDDCYPYAPHATLPALAAAHVAALEPQPVRMFATVTSPPSRGTPYSALDVTMPVAASLGFWRGIGDYCGVRSLAFANAPMTFDRAPISGRYFALCGMNVAFRPVEWSPWCEFINVPRFDDIWMGWLWQREAYRRGYCFNLGGPDITHARQSNVWQNVRDEAVHLEASETLWQKIATCSASDYPTLRGLLPV